MTVRVHLISGPRNLSTALMYSFRSRADTTVYDEPLYGHYLRVTGTWHPGREEVLATMDTDGERAVREIILGDHGTPVVFLKNMGHHLIGVGLELSFLDRVTNVFLIREPAEMLTSLARNIPEPTIEMTGLPQQVELLDRATASGAAPIVVDSRELLLDPPRVLATLCNRIGIGWDPAMLHWPPGPKPEDGVWAPHWYGRLHETSTFEPYRPKEDTVPERLEGLLGECRSYYEQLARHALRAA